jgi:fatty acyl-CoA reductase
VYLFFTLQLFDRLRQERPLELNKIVPIQGDVTEPELGISPTDQNLLIRTVSVVFHSAATVKFDEALKLSVTINMLGTKRLVELCHRMLGLEVCSSLFNILCTVTSQRCKTSHTAVRKVRNELLLCERYLNKDYSE